jgi:hypothetical protein
MSTYENVWGSSQLRSLNALKIMSIQIVGIEKEIGQSNKQE